MNVPFVDLSAEYQSLRAPIDAAVSDVLAGGWYVLGEQVERFESEFAAYCSADHAVGVASGTDALLLLLRGLGIGPGDEVITVAHTAVATVTAIELTGATPVLVDVEPQTYTLDPVHLESAITPRTRAIVPVHLYGQPADMTTILAVAKAHDLLVVEDCAQAHGAQWHGRQVGSLAGGAAFSFYPTKNLGAAGDGGAIVCRDEQLAERLRALRQYGWRERYVSDLNGYNSRLDELQAAILRVKLRRLDRNNLQRRKLAAAYREALTGLPLQLPVERPGATHVYHLFVVQTEDREPLREHLAGQGIATAIHYPVPVHRQPAYRHLAPPRGLPVTEQIAPRLLSLPMFPQMTVAQLEQVTGAIRAFYGA